MILTQFAILVPKPGSRPGLLIDPGSGIVAADISGERVLIYYEGNRYGAENLRTFEERVLVAAGRLEKRYPTVARGSWPREDFDVVGTFAFSADWKEHHVTITNPEALARWGQA